MLQVDSTGTKTKSRRKSPYKGKLTNIFEELVRIPELMKEVNFSVEFPLIREEEVRCRDGKGSKYRKRESIKDRRLLEVVRTHRITKAENFLQFIPQDLPRPFSNKCLTKALSLHIHRCRQITCMLNGKKYMLTTSWNGPETAFTLPGEFFMQKSVDEGPLFGFHRMNAFTGMQPLESIHFHDVEKNADILRDLQRYQAHLDRLFGSEVEASNPVYKHHEFM